MDINDIPPLPPSKVGEKLIFSVIWKTRTHRSFLTSLWLREFERTPFFFNMFAHVLPKALNKYPHFRFYYKNIVLLTPGEHALYDQGTEKERISYSQDVEKRSGGKITANWAGLEALADDLKEEYRKYFPTRRGLIIGYKYDLDEVQHIVGMLNAKYMEDLKNSLSLKKMNPDG